MPGGEVSEGSFTGDGPVDAFFSALNAATGYEARLKEYHVSAVTGGRDALGEVTVLLELERPGRVRPGRVHGHPRGVRQGVPARAVERTRGLARGGGRAPPRGSGAHAGPVVVVEPVRDDFTWIDGERLIRFGAGDARRRSGAALASRLRRLRAAHHRASSRRRTRCLRRAAAAVLHVPPGGVPDAAAAVRDGVGGRPLVAFGGGRVIGLGQGHRRRGRPAAARRCPPRSRARSSPASTACPPGWTQFTLVRPSLVIADPALMASAPMPGIAASAMNALGHAIEALYTPLANPMADAAGLQATALIADALGSGGEPDRPKLALGALLAGYALGATSLGVHHIISQSLVRVAGTPHAQTNAVILPHALRLMVVRVPDVLGRVALALGADSADPAAAPARASVLSARAGVTGLADLGVEWGQLDDVVNAALSRPELRNTPQPPGARELRDLLERAYE